MKRGVRFGNIQTTVSNTSAKAEQQGDIIGFDGRSSQLVSVRMIELNSLRTKAQFQNEVIISNFLEKGTYPFICKVKEIHCNNEWGSIITSHHPKTLFDYVFDIKENVRIIEPEAKRIFTKICVGVKTLHELGIAHLDLKLENIYFNENTGVPHIFNFASAAMLSGTKGSKSFVVDRLGVRGTSECHPPELLSKRKCYDPFKVDIYCLGVLLHILIAKYYPYSRKNEDERAPIFDVAQEHVSELGVSLLKLLLDDNPYNRPTIYEILKHPWIRLGSHSFNSPKLLHCVRKKSQKVRSTCVRKRDSFFCFAKQNNNMI